MTGNILDTILERVDTIALDVRALKMRSKEQPTDERGTIKDAARWANRSESTLYKWVTDPGSTFPVKRVNGRLSFKRSDVEAWLDGNAGNK